MSIDDKIDCILEILGKNFFKNRDKEELRALTEEFIEEITLLYESVEEELYGSNSNYDD